MAKKRKKAKKLSAGLIAFILVVAIIAVVCYYFFVYKKQQDQPVGDTDDTTQTPQNPSNSGGDAATGDVSEISSADLSIHFLELGVHNAGDCVLIKCGNTEVLIDAGAKKNSAPTQRMLDYVADYCTDGVLEYVIATHAHEDHIAGLVGQAKGSTRTGFLYQYKIGTIIQFSRNNTTSGIYNDYVDAVKACKTRDNTKVYSALDCTKGENDAQATYYLDEAETVSMTILYQKYYEQKSSSENNYSVCMLLTQQLGEKQNNYLFTGDLESAGESSLVDENPNLPHCVLYKGGHHGSSTSSSDKLLNKITPENIAICTCAGTYEYAKKPNAVAGELHPEYALNTFPTQEAIDRMSKHTEKIYITTLGIINEDYSTKEFVSMNGDVVFYYGKGAEETEKRLKLWCSNNYTILKDTEWFQANRTWNGAAG